MVEVIVGPLLGAALGEVFHAGRIGEALVLGDGTVDDIPQIRQIGDHLDRGQAFVLHLQTGRPAELVDDQPHRDGAFAGNAGPRFLDQFLQQQVQLDLESLSRAIDRRFLDAERSEIQTSQLRSYRWAFLWSGMTHQNVGRTFSEISPSSQFRLLKKAKTFGILIYF